MRASERMNEFFETVSYVGTEAEIRPWREFEDLATSEDEPYDDDLVPSQRTDLRGTATSGNYGHKGRPGQVGGSAPGDGDGDTTVGLEASPDHAAMFATMKETLYHADDYGSTKFILPDGTRLGHDARTHAQALDQIGIDMWDAMRGGLVRREGTAGVEAGSPITHAQAEHILDGALTYGRDEVEVDIFFPIPTGEKTRQGKVRELRASKTFKTDIAPETIRAWVNGHYSQSLGYWDPRVFDLRDHDTLAVILLGGAGSGNFGHKGRPGEVGGSGEGDGEAEDDPYALAPDAPRGGEGQQALFEYAPEAGSEAALRAEAEDAITSLDAMLPEAVKNADFTGLEAKEWDDLDSDTQNSAYERWEEDERQSDYAQEAGQEAGDQYIRDEMSAEDIFNKASEDETFVELLEKHNIDPESVAYDSSPGENPWLNSEDLTTKAGEPLTNEQRAELGTAFRRAADDAYQTLADDMRDSGGYQDAYSEAESEAIRDNWNNLNDDERFDAAKSAGLVETTDVDHEPPGTWKWDGENDDPDYVQTRAVALELAHQRTVDLMAQRGLVMDVISGDPRALAEKVSETFWSEWKGSSTSPMGIAMQMAVANEMGTLPTAHITEQQKNFANAALINNFTTYAERVSMGYPSMTGDKVSEAAEKAAVALGMGRAQAYVRAQWETTQFVMKQAGATQLELYRAVILPKADVEKASGPQMATGVPLPKLQLLQNAVASTTNDLEVANSWSGVGDKTLGKPNTERVVIRFTAPVTAAFSLPVFGQNVHEESEVVLMGTKGLQWDAWRKHAPTHQSAPLVPPAPPTERIAPSLRGLVVHWDLADPPKAQGPKPIVVDLWRNTDTHWLKGWRKHKDRPLPKRRIAPSPHKRHSDALAQVIVRGMQKGMLPVMKKLADLEHTVSAFLLGSATSGNYGHAGRPGQIGGSAPSGDTVAAIASGEHEYKKADGTVIRFLAQPSQAFDPKKIQRVMGLSVDEVNTLAAAMVNRVPGEVEVRVRTHHNDGQDSVTIKATTQDGVEILHVFDRRGDQLVNTLEFIALPEQGHGIAKQILADTVAAYERVGVDQIRLHANIDVGSYAWAKFGFVADNPRSLARDLNKRLAEPFPKPGAPSFVTLKPAERERLTQIIKDHENDPKLPWHIAQTVASTDRPMGVREVGKELLLNQHWYGHLDLHDDEQRERFGRYVGAK